MKKLFTSFLLAVAVGASAQTFSSKQFLTGPLLVATNYGAQFGGGSGTVTILYGATNLPYWDPVTTNLLFSLTNAYIKFAVTGSTTNGSFATTNTLASQVSLGNWTNTITTATNADGSSLKTFNQAWSDVPTWADRNGDFLTDQHSIVISMVGTNAQFTNLFAFTFAGLHSAGPLFAGAGIPFTPNAVRADMIYPENTTPGSGTFTVGITGNGTTIATVRTNLPAVFLHGQGALRMTQFTITGTNSNGGLILSIAEEGWTP